MAVIVIHAGTPKTGSSSIQEWLQVSASDLRERGFTVVVAPPEKEGEIAFVPFEEGEIKSEWIVRRHPPRRRASRQVGCAFAAALQGAAERYGNVIVTGEHLAPLFAARDLALPPFQRLSMHHEVRVAYYARPQHGALEAIWREMGYRAPLQPSACLRKWVPSLRYGVARAAVRALAPGLRFEPTPFRRDLLESGDVVVDFARRFLEVEPGRGRWANRGLPLEVVNLLRASPTRSSAGNGFSQERLKRSYELLADHRLPEDDRAVLSRRVLQKFAYETYGSENASLGWEDFVPLPDGADEIPGLEALDELWEPQASPAELALLARALDAPALA